jgi:hypothetical protein
MLLGNFGLQRARVLPESCLDDDENDDEADNEEEEEYQRTFLPERMLPRQQNFRIHPSKSTFYDEDLEATAARHRSPSTGDMDYLRAPERFTRFEI